MNSRNCWLFFPLILIFYSVMVSSVTPTSLDLNINNGSRFTNSNLVDLDINAVNIAEMRFSCDNTYWSSWENFALTKNNWNLTGGAYGCSTNDRNALVYFQARDNAGSAATAIYDWIIFDTNAPLISNLKFDSNSWSDYNYLNFGDMLDVNVYGQADANGTFSMGSIVTDLNLFDDGQHNDGDSNDGLYSGIYTVGNTQSSGLVSLIGYLTDTSSNTRSFTTSLQTIIDNNAPTVSYTPLDYGARQPTITINVSDSLAGVDMNSVKLTVDSVVVPDVNFTKTAITDGNTLSYTYPNILSSGSTVDLTFDVNDLADNNIAQLSWTLTIDANAPQPLSVTATAVASTNDINVSWNPGFDAETGVASYKVYRSASAITSVASLTAIATGITDLNYYDDFTAASEGNTYYYVAIATDNAGNDSNISNSDSAVVGDVSAPSSPTISITDSNNFTSDTTPTITVSAASAVSVRFSCNNIDFKAYQTYVTSITDFNITDTNSGCTAVDGNKTVYAVFKDVNDRNTVAVMDWTVLDRTQPTMPTYFTAVTNSSGWIDLNWHASSDNTGGSGVDHYDVYWADNTDHNVDSRDNNKLVAITNWTHRTNYEKTYYYRVRAVDALGNASSLTEIVSAKMDIFGPSYVFDINAGREIVGKWWLPGGGLYFTLTSNDVVDGYLEVTIFYPDNSSETFNASGSIRNFYFEKFISDEVDGEIIFNLVSTNSRGEKSDLNYAFFVDNTVPEKLEMAVIPELIQGVSEFHVLTANDVYDINFFYKNLDLAEESFTSLDSSVADGNTDWFFYWNSELVVDGNYEFKVIVFDEALNSKNITFDSQVENFGTDGSTALTKLNNVRDFSLSAVEEKTFLESNLINLSPEVITAFGNAENNLILAETAFTERDFNKSISLSEQALREFQQFLALIPEVEVGFKAEKTYSMQELLSSLNDSFTDNSFFESSKQLFNSMQVRRELIVFKVTETNAESYQFNVRVFVTPILSRSNLRFVEIVPKSIAVLSDDLTLPSNAVVLVRDPVIQFNFDSLSEGEEVFYTYKLKNPVDLATARLLASDLKLNEFIAPIPVLGEVILTRESFTDSVLMVPDLIDFNALMNSEHLPLIVTIIGVIIVIVVVFFLFNYLKKKGFNFKLKLKKEKTVKTVKVKGKDSEIVKPIKNYLVDRKFKEKMDKLKEKQDVEKYDKIVESVTSRVKRRPVKKELSK
ncbi:MAG: choice-of-anchor X domain-containing protein [archaeon]